VPEVHPPPFRASAAVTVVLVALLEHLPRRGRRAARYMRARTSRTQVARREWKQLTSLRFLRHGSIGAACVTTKLYI
jgi:hypothetical protein